MRRQGSDEVDDRAADAVTRSPALEEEVSPVVTHSEEEGRSGAADRTRSGSSTQPLPQSDGAAGDDQQVVQRLQQEVAALYAHLDIQGDRQQP